MTSSELRERLAAAHEMKAFGNADHDGEFDQCRTDYCRMSKAIMDAWVTTTADRTAAVLSELDTRLNSLSTNVKRRWGDEDALMRNHAVRIEGLEKGQADLRAALGVMDKDDEDPAARVTALEQRLDDLVEGFRKVEELEARQRVLERAVAAKGFKA